MVTYDVFRVLNVIPRAVDWSVDGLWDEVGAERDDLIAEAKSRIYEAVVLIESTLDEEMHFFVSSEDIAHVAVALALKQLEGWDVAVEEALYHVSQEAGRWYDAALLQGDA